MAGQYVDGLKKLPADQMGPKKDDVKRLNGAFQFLAKFNILPATFPAKVEIEKIIKDQRWEK